ncbi:hypothetical protein, partial [Borrelia hispanica]|uniref:hypothetical protein n=1 Tax=Borrelia hispanica TaxID=40835 RepID=UPI000571F35F
MKFKNKFLILSLLFSFMSCDFFFGVNSNKDAIADNSESLEHVDSETSKKRSRRSVLEEIAEVVEPVAVLKAVLKPVVVEPVVADDKEEEKIVVAEVVAKEEAEVVAEEAAEEAEEEEKNVKNLEVKLQLNKDDVRDVKDALYWIKTIKEKKSDIMYEVLAISGDIELLKKIVSQKYKQEDKVDNIRQLLDSSRQMVIGIMKSSYKYNEESFVKLEANFEEVKNFLEEA